jgi:FkbM family methyltransferase
MSRLLNIILHFKAFIQRLIIGLRFNLSANNSILFIGFYKYFFRPKKNSLQEFLHLYSLSKLDKFFVIQIGANDGMTFDPIHKFIKRDKWKGVLLEPQKEVYNKSLKILYRHNPEINCICAAIGDSDQSRPIYKIGFSEMRWATGLASFSKKKIEEAFENGIVKYNCDHFGIELPSDKNEWIIEENVEVISPETLIQKYNINDISLLQIDAEGYDFEVIKIFNIDKITPEAIIYENVGLSSEEYLESVTYLQKFGYSIRQFGPNTLAMKNPQQKFQKYFTV